jgi:hypothetical protein
MNKADSDSIPLRAEMRGIEEEKWFCPLSGQRYIITLPQVGRYQIYEIQCNEGGHGEIVKDKTSWE